MKNESIIYFAPDCHECDYIREYITTNNISIKTELLSIEDRIEKGIYVFPALLNNNTIVAYGKDIINYLVK